MFRSRLRLFRLLGFEVGLHPSWLIIAALVLWSLARGIFPAYVQGLNPGTYWWMAAAGAVGLFLSIILHEFGHSIIARVYGIRMRGITLFVFGGVAEMAEEPPSPKSELVMAIAGPITSLILAGIAYGIRHMVDALSWPVQATVIFAYLSWINLLLAAFNMIPAFPLDGGRVLRAVLWGLKKSVLWATRVASAVGTGFAFLLMFLGVLSLFFGNFVGGIWWVILGLFVRGASQASYQQVRLREALTGRPVSQFMNDHPVTVPPSISVKDLIENYVYRYHYKMFPVVDDGRLVGCVTVNQLRQIPREEWETRRAQALAQPCGNDNAVSPEADAMSVLANMNRNQVGRLMVVDQGRLLGVIGLKELASFLSRKMELEGV